MNAPTLLAALVAAIFILRSRSVSAQEDLMPIIYEIPPDEDESVTQGDYVSAHITDSSEANLKAFIFMIAAAETGVERARDGTAYTTFFGGSQFADLSNHPVLTGEKKGIRLSDQMCRNAGYGPGCVSTAAGAGQIIKPTWEVVRQSGPWGFYLDDFGVENQNEAIRRVLIQADALNAVENGDFDLAVARASTKWASLPGSTARQRPKSLARVAMYFNEGVSLA